MVHARTVALVVFGVAACALLAHLDREWMLLLVLSLVAFWAVVRAIVAAPKEVRTLGRMFAFAAAQVALKALLVRLALGRVQLRQSICVAANLKFHRAVYSDGVRQGGACSHENSDGAVDILVFSLVAQAVVQGYLVDLALGRVHLERGLYFAADLVVSGIVYIIGLREGGSGSNKSPDMEGNEYNTL
jgi:hypothetical protein